MFVEKFLELEYAYIDYMTKLLIEIFCCISNIQITTLFPNLITPDSRKDTVRRRTSFNVQVVRNTTVIKSISIPIATTPLPHVVTTSINSKLELVFMIYLQYFCNLIRSISSFFNYTLTNQLAIISDHNDICFIQGGQLKSTLVSKFEYVVR